MTIFRRSTPGGEVIFCNDARDEGLGKATYEGVYDGGEITAQIDLPVRMAKMTIVTSYYERPNESTEPVIVTVTAPWSEKPLARFDVPVERFRSMPIPADADADDPIIGMILKLEIRPLLLEAEGRIRVRAWRGNDEIRLGSILVRNYPRDEAPATSVANPTPSVSQAAGEDAPETGSSLKGTRLPN